MSYDPQFRPMPDKSHNFIQTVEALYERTRSAAEEVPIETGSTDQIDHATHSELNAGLDRCLTLTRDITDISLK